MAMRKYITRTILSATIHPISLTIKEGKPVVETLEPVVVVGNPTDREAMKAVKDVYGSDCTAKIERIDIEEGFYQISVADFIKYATKVDKAETAE